MVNDFFKWCGNTYLLQENPKNFITFENFAMKFCYCVF